MASICGKVERLVALEFAALCAFLDIAHLLVAWS